MKVKVLVTQSCGLFVTPWTVAHQASVSMEFSRQEYWSGYPFPSLGNLPDSGIKPGSPALQGILYHLSHQGEGVHGKSLCLREAETALKNSLKKKKAGIYTTAALVRAYKHQVLGWTGGRVRAPGCKWLSAGAHIPAKCEAWRLMC